MAESETSKEKSIVTRLTRTFVGLAIVPLVVIGSVLVFGSFVVQREQALLAQVQYVERVTVQVSAFIDELEAELRLVNQIRSLDGLSPEEQRNTLSRVQAQEHIFRELRLLGSQGQKLAISTRVGIVTSDDIKSRAETDEFLVPMASGETYYGPVRIDTETGEPTMIIAVPLVDIKSGEPTGVLAADIRFKQVWDFIADIPQARGECVYILNSEGKVIAHHNPSIVLRGTEMQVPGENGIQRGLENMLSVLAVGDLELGEQIFYVVAEQPVLDALAFPLRALLITGIVLILMFTVSIYLGTSQMQAVVLPLQGLALVAGKIAEGDLEERALVNTSDEIGILGSAFNTMAEQLQHTISELEVQVKALQLAEVSLLESEAGLKEAQQIARIGSWDTDLQNDVVTWSDELYRIFQIDPGEILDQDTFLAEVVHPDDKILVEEASEKAMDSGELSPYEFRVIRGDGEVRTLWSKGVVDKDAQGTPLRFRGVNQDITERKKASDALRKSEERLKEAHRIAKLGDWSIDLQTGEVSWSEELRHMMQISLDAELDQNAVTEKFFHPDDVDTINSIFQEAIAAGELSPVKFRAIRGDGEVRTLWSKGVVERDAQGNPLRFRGVNQDVTERRRAQDEITKLSKMVETTSQAIVIADVEGHVVYVNTALLSTLGFDKKEEVVGKSIFEFTDDEGARRLSNEILPQLQKDGHWQGEIGSKRKDGTIFPCDEFCNVLRNEKGEVEFYVAAFVDVTERVLARDEIREYIKRLDALRKIDQTIINSFDLHVTLGVILDYVLSHLRVDAAAVLRHDASTLTLTFVRGQGFRTKTLRKINLRLGHGLAGSAALERRSVFVPDLSKEDFGISGPVDFSAENFISYYGVPLLVKGVLVGVLEVFHRSELNPDDEWVKYLELLAGQTAIAIDNIALFENLERSNTRLTQAYDATIEGWAQALELRDMETEGHSRRVVKITVALAKMLGISGSDLTHVRRGALLHDIGKMGVPDSILQKTGKLTKAEWDVMKSHPALAHDWLSSIEYLRPALDIPYCHHEKWDGTGYPQGLKGEQIPLAARIFTVVDHWDALRSDRPYRKAWSREKVLTYIKEQSGIYFDPEVVAAFLKYIEAEGE